MTGDFGDTRIRILATSGTVSAASICAMACAAFESERASAGSGTSASRWRPSPG
jgi:hypothetical protein